VLKRSGSFTFTFTWTVPVHWCSSRRKARELLYADGQRLFSKLMSRPELEETIRGIVEAAGIQRASVAYYDYRSGEEFAWGHADFFHAASTIKVAVLLAVFMAWEEKRLRLDDSLHVRNRFLSVGDGMPYRLQRNRDANGEVHDRIGRTMHIERLARLMITVSSNLATNLLLDFVGAEYAKDILREAGIEGIRLKRGVEDNAAHEMRINNEVTAVGLVRLFRLILDAKFISAASRNQMLEILCDQQFNAMIPEKLPEGTRVAHKTGEVSTACHDAGLVFLEGREPYALAILTEIAPEATTRYAPVAEISEAVFRHLSEA
jgi:beta-lactamase class A